MQVNMMLCESVSGIPDEFMIDDGNQIETIALLIDI